MIKYQREQTGGHAVVLALAVAAAAIAGCAEPPSPEPDGEATSKLTMLPGSPQAVPQVCSQNRYCSFKPATGSDADTSHYPLWGRLGCGAIYNFENGPDFGLGALCVDSPDNRAALHSSHLTGLVPIGGCVQPPLISPCLHLPVGVIFVDFNTQIPEPQPFCPSTCLDTPKVAAF